MKLLLAPLLLLGLLFAAPQASAAIHLTYTQGAPDTMQVAVDTENEDFQTTNPLNSADYVFDTECAGCSDNTVFVDNSVPVGMCSPAAQSETITCDPAQGGDVPYRLVFTNDATHTMEINMVVGPGNAAGRFPTLVTVNAVAATLFRNNTEANVDFNGGAAADHYQMGGGAEFVHGNGGVDTASYLGSATAVVSLDNIANDSVSNRPGVFDNVFSDTENVIGSAGGDQITGGTGDNDLDGAAGLDTIDGGEGNNDLHAGPNGATMTAGLGDDLFDGDPGGGGDVIAYASRTGFVQASTNGVADDGVLPEQDNLDGHITRIVGGNGGNVLDASSGVAARLIGGTAPDILIGSGEDAPDCVAGTGGCDFLEGGAGNDQITAGAGDDIVKPGTGLDTYDGGADIDNLDYTDAVVGMNLSINDGTNDGEGGLEVVNSSFQNLKSGSGDDTLIGDTAANTLISLGGADSLDGKGGPDQLDGEGLGLDGRCDRLKGGAGNDLLQTLADNGCRTTIDYSDHSGVGVTVNLAAGFSAQNVAPGETDTIVQGNSLDVIGGAQADTLTVTTATGAHTLTGGLGNDTLTGAPGGSDTAGYADRAVSVTADLDGVNDDGQAGEADVLADIDHLTGGSAGDTLAGDANANVLDGLGGNDTLTGNPGADTLRLGPGDDTFAALDGIVDTIDCTGGGADSGTFDTSPADSFVGCLDGDGDGVANFLDACPAQAGTLANGCAVAATSTPATTKKCKKGKKLKKAKGKKKCVKKKRKK